MKMKEINKIQNTSDTEWSQYQTQSSVENQIYITRDSWITLLKSSNRLIDPHIWSHTRFVF